MIENYEVRCQVQRNDSSKNKYYPYVVQGDTNEQLSDSSLTVPRANIEVVSNDTLGASGYSSPIRSDDIVKFQVSRQILGKSQPSKLNKKVWETFFEGTVQEIEKADNASNNNIFHCVGHIEEAVWTEIEETKSWTTTTDAQAVFQYILSTKAYHRRLTYNSSYCKSGITFSNYATTVNQTFLDDVISEMEKYSGLLWRASAVPTYDANGNLSTVYLSWKALPTTITRAYAVLEGSWGCIDANFASTEEDLRNRYTVIGSTSSGYKATYTDAVSMAAKGKRTRIDTFTWANSTNQCSSIASGVGADIKNPKLYGSALLNATPQARVGDLIYCYYPSQEVNGAIINNNMRVYRLVHKFGASNVFTTAIDLDRVNKKSAYEYQGMTAKEVATCKKNIVKCC